MLNDFRRIGLLFLALFIVVIGFVFVPQLSRVVSEYQAAQRLEPCRKFSLDDEQVECIFREIDGAIEGGNLKRGLDVFATAYNRFPSFAGTGCHRHAHRVGDTIYYQYYVLGDNLDALEFPQEATACGYGLFHGFLEHLIQDRPDPEFSMEVCDTLDRKLSSTMKDIRVICYHGTGHGYTLSNAETLPKSDWGDIRAFSDDPVAQCNAMDRATESEKEDCRQGVFNVIADWMEEKNYGFFYDTDNPFRLCNTVPSDVQYACYYEMAQKIGGLIAHNDPVELAAVAATATKKEFADLAFSVGIAGIIQQTIVDGNGYDYVLSRCEALSSDLFHLCLESAVWGLYEHGLPQEEYKNALSLCEEPAVLARGEQGFCYEKTAARLPRFYTKERIQSICDEFPEPYQPLCKAQGN